MFYGFKQAVDKPFGQLQDYISDEAIAHCNVTDACEDISSFNVSDEVHIRIGFYQLSCLFNNFIALCVFLSDAHKSHPWVLNSM